jgi:acetyl esterase/lipase
MQGFPGNEQNMDLAYSIRRAGWHVLVPHCRGAWGSEGAYSFSHALEDTQAAVQFLRDPENVKKYRIDPKRLVLIGHSAGGFMVAYATARDTEILGVGMIAASNLGPSTMRAWSRDPQEIQARFRANASRLAGTTSETLLEEVKQNAANWNYLDYAPALKDRPVLIAEADDRNTPDNQALAAALKKLGNSRVTETHMATDHIFSDHRIALQAVVLEWLQSIGAQTAK